MPNDFNHFWFDHAQWSNRTFGDEAERSELGPIRHLKKEVREAEQAFLDNGRRSAQVKEEVVDLFLLVLDAARRAGFSPHTLIVAAFAKLLKCKGRVYRKVPEGQASEHDRSRD